MSNTKQPTYEELMEMLQKERSKNAQLLKNIEEKDAQIANFKEVVAPILKEAFHSTSLIAKELNKYCFNIDDLLIKDLTEQIAFTADVYAVSICHKISHQDCHDLSSKIA